MGHMNMVPVPGRQLRPTGDMFFVESQVDIFSLVVVRFTYVLWLCLCSAALDSSVPKRPVWATFCDSASPKAFRVRFYAVFCLSTMSCLVLFPWPLVRSLHYSFDLDVVSCWFVERLFFIYIDGCARVPYCIYCSVGRDPPPLELYHEMLAC